MNPRGRTKELETQWVEGELVVYDLRSHRAHTLSPLTARVWEQADGSKDVAGLLQVLSTRHALQATSAEVETALGALAQAGLLEESGAVAGVSRADFLRNAAAVTGVGLVGAATLKSIIAPTPAAAQSGGSTPTGGGGGGGGGIIT